jgi:CBS domain-containing protein/sporulation protein YlmC with PRC-barrel domain
MGIFSDLPHSTVYFSNLLGTKIFNQHGFLLGEFSDIFVDYENIYPEVLAIQLKKNNKNFYIVWDDIKEFSYKKIVLNEMAEVRHGEVFPRVKSEKEVKKLLSGHYQGETLDYPSLGKTILDRQVVDVSGKKVVRVNDIYFIRVGSHLRITHVAVGFTSMIRRLGYEPFFNFLKKYLPVLKRLVNKEVVINWKFVHAVPGKNIQKNVKLNTSDVYIEQLHPADLADILEDLDSFGRKHIFSQLDPEMKAKTLSEVEEEIQNSLIDDSNPQEIAEIIENMGPDEAADLLHDIDQTKQTEIISKIEDDEHQEEIQELLTYKEDTAGGIMSTESLEVKSNFTKDQIIKQIQENHEDLETVYDIYVTDEKDRLIGTCSLRQLIINRENIEVKDIMETTDMKYMYPDDSWEDVAEFMSKYNLINVPIVEEKDLELLGVVSVDDILPWTLDDN